MAEFPASTQLREGLAIPKLMLGLHTAPRLSGIDSDQTAPPPPPYPLQTAVASDLSSAIGRATWPKTQESRQSCLFSPHCCLGGD